MGDTVVPDARKPGGISANLSFEDLNGQIEPCDGITPASALKNITSGGYCQEEINILEAKPAVEDSLLVAEMPVAAEKARDIHAAGSPSVEGSASSGDSLTGSPVSPVVEEAKQLTEGYLRRLATDPDFSGKMNLAFGNSWDATVAGNLAQDWLTGVWGELPAVEIRAGVEINGANGAFAARTGTIYISSEFVAKNAGNPEAIASVLLEEVGHYIDWRVNTSDSAGDEGAIFAGAVQNKECDAAELQALKAEDDTAIIALDGKVLLIEQAVADSAGNTLAAARTVTVGPTAGSFSDWVGADDTNDYYKFSLTGTNTLSLSLSGLTGNADVQLIRDANSNGVIDTGEVLQSSANTGTTAESVSRSLSAGTYFARVYPGSGVNTNYNLSLTATPADSAGNTLAAARTVTVGPTAGSFSDWVGAADTNDFYKFSLTGTNTLSLSLSGLTGNADVQLIRDANNNGVIDTGEVLQTSANTGTTAESVSRSLSAGTYLARVYPGSGVNTNYNLSLTATPADSAGNTLAAARTVTVGPTAGTYSDFVGTADTNDYYKFSLTGTNTLSLSLSGLTGNADVQLIRDANNNGVIDTGEVLQTAANTGTTAESLSFGLGAGTYFARVYLGSGINTNYNLSLSATPTNPGNSLGAALNIGTLSGTQTFGDFVGSVDRDDVYRFSLSGTSNFNLSLSNLNDSAHVALIWDSNGNGEVDDGEDLRYDSGSTYSSGQISTALGAGTYFVWVYTGYVSDSTNYTLQLSATPTPATTASNPGNTLGAALNIGTLSSSQNLTDFVGSVDRDDFYRFSLAGTSNFNLSLSGLSDSANVQLIWDSNGNGVVDSSEVLDYDYGSSSSNGSITTPLGAGTYFLRVYTGYSEDNTNYTLSLSAPAAPATTSSNPGNTLGAALNIGTLSNSQNLTDFVGSVDRDDFYRFSLSATSNFNLSLSGLSDSANVQLIWDSNGNGVVDSSEVLDYDYGYSSSSGEIITPLGAGTYFVRVYTDSLSYNTNYTLSLSAPSAPATTSSNPGNTLGAALDIGTLSASRTLTDFVGSVDRDDFYRFSLSATSNFNLSLSGLSDSANVQLIWDSNGNGVVDSSEVLDSDYGSSYSNGSITTPLGAGTYFLRVYTDSLSYNTNYTLSLSAPAAPATTSSNPGNTLGAALNIGTLSSSQTFGDFVGSVDRDDFYRFSLSGTSNFNLSLRDLSDYAYVQLIWDSNGNGLVDSGEVLESGYGSSYSTGAITTPLGAGTYFLRVYTDSLSYNTNYTLQLSAPAAPATTSSNPGNTLGAALNIGTLSGSRTLTDFVGSVDRDDFYRFSLSGTSNFNASLSNLSEYANVQLIVDSNGNGLVDYNEVLKSGYGSSSSNGSMTTSLGAGTYFVRVYTDYLSYNTNYTLSVSV